MYPCFIAVLNMGTSSGAYELNHERETERVPILDFRDKTRVQMF